MSREIVLLVLLVVVLGSFAIDATIVRIAQILLALCAILFALRYLGVL